MDDASAGPNTVNELAARCDAAYSEWQALNRDPQCWSDPDKRQAMLSARIAYQDALSEYVTALRAAQAADSLIGAGEQRK